MTRIRFRSDLEWGSQEPAIAPVRSGEPRVSYDASKDGPLEPFVRSDKGATVQSQFRENISVLRDFLNNRAPKKDTKNKEKTVALENLAKFEQRIGEGMDGLYSKALHALYGGGKQALDRIVAHINSRRISGARLDALEALVVEMALGIGVCGAGVGSHFMIAEQQGDFIDDYDEQESAQGTGHITQRKRENKQGVGEYARIKWEKLFDQGVREFAESEHGGEETYRSNELHLVNEDRNLLAAQFYVRPRTDDHALGRPSDPARLERCRQYLREHVPPGRLLRVLAEECLQTIHEHFGQYVGRPMNEQEAAELRAAYENTLSGRLAMRYGEIDGGTVINEYCADNIPPDVSADSPYSLIINPTLLMRDISKSLFNAGVFDETYKPERVVGQKGDERVIKQIHDAYYTRERRAYRPLRIDELIEFTQHTPEILNDGRRFASLLRNAMANTQSEKSLARVPARHVWSLVAHESGSISLVERMAHPDIKRYRSACEPPDDAFLLEKAASAISNLPPEQRQAPLLVASRLGESALAQRIADQLHEVSGVDAMGRSALHYAALNGDAELIAVLVAKGKKLLNTFDRRDATPLMLAARGGHVGAVERLVKAGALDLSDRRGVRAMMIAAAFGHLEVVDRLIAFGARVNATNRGGRSALAAAADNDHIIVMERLLAANAQVNTKDAAGQTELMRAANLGRPRVLELLLKNGALIDAKSNEGWTALMMAARQGHVEVVEQLIAAGAEIDTANFLGGTALMLAASGGHREVIAQLVKAGAEVNRTVVRRATALIAAAALGQRGAVEQLLGLNADIHRVDAEGNTALIMAAKHGHYEVIERLLAERAEVNNRNASGFTATMIAAKNGHREAVERLLNISSVDLSNSLWEDGIVDVIAEVLLKNRVIVSIDLSYNQLARTGDGAGAILRALCQNDVLREANLSGNGLGRPLPRARELAAALTGIENLTSANLSDNWLGSSEEGFRAVTAALGQHARLAYVDLSKNRLESSAHVHLISEMLRRSASLTFVDLRGNGFDEDQKAALTLVAMQTGTTVAF